MDDVNSEVEYMRYYIKRLENAQNNLLKTYNEVRNHSEYIAKEIWQDAVSESFMDMLNTKQKDLMRITEALQHYREIIKEKVDVLEELEKQHKQLI